MPRREVELAPHLISPPFLYLQPQRYRRRKVQNSPGLEIFHNQTMATSIQHSTRSNAASSKSDNVRGTKRFSINDHNEDEVSIAWRTESRCIRNDKLPPFPFQVYIVSSATQVSQDIDFACELAATIRDGERENERCRFHFQVYHRPFPNILGCGAHQRREILHRNRNGIVPRMISRWTQTDH